MSCRPARGPLRSRDRAWRLPVSQMSQRWNLCSVVLEICSQTDRRDHYSTPLGGLNGGTCVVWFLIYARGQTDRRDHCSTPLGGLNGGTCWCAEGTKSCRCECPPGFTDPTCSSLIDPCQSRPCLHASTCYTLASSPGSSYACACVAGYTGSRCEREINECESNPCAGFESSCVDLVAGFICACPPGFSGRNKRQSPD